MLDVCDYFNLHISTSYLAVVYLDRIQPNDKFSRFEWQMLAICCIIVASKYNECESIVPDLKTLEEITHQKITNQTLLSYELWTLKRMGWKLHARTHVNFLLSYISLGIVFNGDHYQPLNCNYVVNIPNNLFNILSVILYIFSNICITEIAFKPYLASDIATVIVYLARRYSFKYLFFLYFIYNILELLKI